MSRSIKKHCGGKICCCLSDKISKQFWHKTARRRVNVQLKVGATTRNFDDIVFWKKKQEVSDNYDFASDGGSHWQYLDFEHYYRDNFKFHYKIRCYGIYSSFPTREEAWYEWITEMVGK
jgi:hypothetical protein